MSNEALTAKFIEKKQLATDTWQFVFQRPSGFKFVAGQFTTVFLGKENRDFTICIYPQNENYFRIVTKKGISNFKKNIFSLKRGSEIVVTKPSGGFIIHENKVQKVFIAGGIGITVFYTIIHYIVQQKILTPVVLVASFSKKDHIIFYDELQKIQKENKNIRIIYSLSQDEWDGEKGRISERLIKKYVPQFETSEFMIAGGEQMVYDSEEMLLKAKVPQENIRIDVFTGYQ